MALLKEVCYARIPFDYESYGFKEYDNEACYWINGTKRIIIDKKTKLVKFNCMCIEALRVFANLVEAERIYFTWIPKRDTVTISASEYYSLLDIKNAWEAKNGK